MLSVTEDSQNLFGRLDNIEKQYRRMKLLCVTMFLLTCSAFLCAFAASQREEVVLIANRFDLEDVDGFNYGGMQFARDGLPRIYFSAEDGEDLYTYLHTQGIGFQDGSTSIYLGTIVKGDNGLMLRLSSAHGIVDVFTGHIGYYFHILDKTSRAGIEMEIKEGIPLFRLLNNKGEVIWEVPH